MNSYDREFWAVGEPDPEEAAVAAFEERDRLAEQRDRLVGARARSLHAGADGEAALLGREVRRLDRALLDVAQRGARGL